MSGADDDTEKSHEPTPEKLRKAREKGEIAKSNDLSVAAAYAGLLVAMLAVGEPAVRKLGAMLMVLLDQPDELRRLVFEGPVATPFGGIFLALFASLTPWFVIPAVAVLGSLFAQRAIVFAPTKLAPKLSRISVIANAKNKFGRSGLFEFTKSFVKLCLYSICLGLFLRAHMTEIIGAMATGPRTAVALLGRLMVDFMFIAVVIAGVIGAVDAVWQHQEHNRKNRMSRKEMMDEAKDAEGDPHMKHQRRMRGHAIATSKMMADVPTADVVIVNPTHFAVALKWSRKKGSAPVCVAKGVDEIAATIRRVAQEAGVPVHRDAPTARALHQAVEVGQEISEDMYGPVAAAIRFAEQMRRRASGQVR